jgi:hypothetical protein
MEKYSIKQLKDLVKQGIATDVTYAHKRTDIPEGYTQVGFASGIYGCNGMLLKGESGQLYAVTSRTTAIYIF